MKIETKYRYLTFDPNGGSPVSWDGIPELRHWFWANGDGLQRSSEVYIPNQLDTFITSRIFDTEAEEDVRLLEALIKL